MSYYSENREKVCLRVNTRTRELAVDVFTAYGGACECCGETRSEYLSIVRGGCRGETKLVGQYRRGHSLYAWLAAHNYPKDNYHLRCLNCNMSIKLYGYCPHNFLSSPLFDDQSTLSIKKRYIVRRKQRIIVEYGGRCSVCGETRGEFLTIDHINGGGFQHRKEMYAKGTEIYSVLKSSGFPKDKYRLLCFNCNGRRVYRSDRQFAPKWFQDKVKGSLETVPNPPF